MTTHYMAEIEFFSGDERYGEGQVFLAAADAEEGKRIARMVGEESFLWDARLPDRSMSVSLIRIDPSEVPDGERLYTALDLADAEAETTAFVPRR